MSSSVQPYLRALAGMASAQHEAARPALRLYTYPVPWDVINVSADERALYERILYRDPPHPEHAYIGAAQAVHRELPQRLPKATTPAEAALFFLPLSPWHLCFAADHELQLKIKLKMIWDRAKPAPVERIMDPARYSGGWRMRVSTAWPRDQGLGAEFNRTMHTCKAYERAVQWVLSQPSWAAAPDRHVWMFEFPHWLRASLRTEETHLGRAVSLYARMAKGILLAQEDRMADWEQSRAARHLVVVPFSTPDFFVYDLEARGAKPITVAESSGSGVSCHRFDSPRSPGAFFCSHLSLQNPNLMRQAVKLACEQLPGGAALSPLKRNVHYGSSFLLRKAALYNHSTFCIVPPGDSAMTPRIYSFTAALCIPVFTIPRTFLPFQSQIEWEKMSIEMSPEQARRALRWYQRVSNASTPVSSLPNPLVFLTKIPRQKVEEMQAELARVRALLLYQGGGAVRAIAAELAEMFGV